MTRVDISQLAIERRPPPGPTAAGGGRRWATRYLLPGLLLLGFASLVGWTLRETYLPATAVRVLPVEVSLASSAAEGGILFQAAGWVEPRPTPIRVAALSAGIVEQLLVVEDQPVTAGQPVAELIRADAELEWKRAQATVRLREAELQQAEAVWRAAQTRWEYPTHLDAELAAARARLAELQTAAINLPYQIRRAETELQFAQRDYERKVAVKETLPGRDVDEAKARWQAAQESVDELQERVSSLEQERDAWTAQHEAVRRRRELLTDELQARDESQAQRSAAVARLQQAQVAEEDARLRLERMTVRAPVDGRVYRLIAQPGAHTGSGMMHMPGFDSSTVVTLYQPDQLQVRVDVRFEHLPQVQLGQPVTLRNPALPEPLAGAVLFIGSEADIQKNTLSVKVAIQQPPPLLKPEMLMDVTFMAYSSGAASAPEAKPRIYVPRRLVQTREGQSAVWLADRSSRRARLAPVQLGSAHRGEMLHVAEGLDAGSRLIDAPPAELRDGERIEILGEAALGVGE